MPLIRLICMTLFCLALAACGGGGSLETTTGNNDSYKLEVTILSYDSGAGISTISKDIPGKLVATLTKNGKADPNKLITFTLEGGIGTLDPESGTAQTNTTGTAEIKLRAGSVAGAGKVIASFGAPEGATASVEHVFTSLGDEGDGGGEQGALKLTVSVIDSKGNMFDEQNPVTTDNMGIVNATITQDGVGIQGALVSFTTQFTGEIKPATPGTAITNSQGIAKIDLAPGNFKGAGKVIATYAPVNGAALTNETVFYSSGDGAPIEQAVAVVDVKILVGCNAEWGKNRDSVKLDPTSNGCKVVNRVSSDSIADIYITATDTNTGDGFKNILVSAETTLGKILPESGTAITDNFGVAILKLQPSADGGAGEVKATAKGVSKSTAFEIGVAEIELEIDNGLPFVLDESGAATDKNQPLAAGATTVITIKIKNTDKSLMTLPLEVELTSGCTQAGLSVLDEKVTSIGGIATATYRTKGCNVSQGDTVVASVVSGGSAKFIETNIPVSSAPVESISFIDATNTVLALKGTGGQGRSETSEVTFKLIDSVGQAVRQARMDFKLSSTNGGISVSPKTVNTDNDGISRVQVNSGTVPMAVRVHACYIPASQIPISQLDDVTCWKERYDQCKANEGAAVRDAACPSGKLNLVALDQQIITVSDLVSTSTGLPDNNSFTASPDIINAEGLDYNGEISNITILMADHFNNPVPDGTAVYVTTEGGAVGTLDGTAFNPQLECRTVDGKCEVQWRSQDPKPFTEAKWNNTVGSFNPKTNAVNCDTYFGQAAPCLFGIRNAAYDPLGVPLGGRATVLATAKGEESFVDRNGNGVFDNGEFYSSFDLAEAFRDDNENGIFEGDVDCESVSNPCSPANTNGGQWEEFVDLNNDQVHSSADGKFNGLVCTADAEALGKCTKDLIDVRRRFEIVMSGSEAYYRFNIAKASVPGIPAYGIAGMPADCSNYKITDKDGIVRTLLSLEPSESADFCDVAAVDLTPVLVHIDDDNDPATPIDNDDSDPTSPDSPVNVGLGATTINFYYSDLYNNSLPAGTSVDVAATNGDFSGRDTETLPNSARTTARGFSFTIAPEATPNKKSSGSVNVKFTTPKQVISQASLVVLDAG